MFGKVYCYGGSVFRSTTVSQVDSVMNVLDLTNRSGIAASDLQNLWTPITYNPRNVNVASRADPQCIVLEDGKRMIVNGGYDSTANQLININFAYDAAENQWEALEDYTEEPYGRRQMYVNSIKSIFYKFNKLAFFEVIPDQQPIFQAKVLHSMAVMKCRFIPYSNSM